MEPNFTVDLHKTALLDPRNHQSLNPLNGLTMKSDESYLAIHQTYMFFMNHNNLPITRFTIGEGRIIQPKALEQNQLVFPHRWINEYEQNNKPLQVYETP